MSSYPNSHWVGTARMGDNPKNSVVNEELRVWNVNGLRIAGKMSYFQLIF